MRKVTEAAQIYPVFRELFKKEGAGMTSSAMLAAAGGRRNRPPPAPSDWSFELIERYHEVIRQTESATAWTPTRTSSRSSPPSR